jgi:Double-GTPase 2
MDEILDGLGWFFIALGIAAGYLAALGLALAIGCVIAVGAVPVLVVDLVGGYFLELRAALRRPATPEIGGEPAYRQYFFGPATRDLRETVTRGRRRAGTRLSWYADGFTGLALSDDLALFTWSAVVPLWAGLGIGALLAFAAGLVVIALHACVVVATQLAARLCIAGLRIVDTVMLRAKGIRGMRCPWCYALNTYPRYRCSCEAHQCARLHRDVRPGRYGVFRRRCACGCLLPTLIVLGSYRLNAVCALEDHQMSDETGRFPELVVPFLGGVAAGKTRLMAVLLVALQERATRGDIGIRVANAETQVALHDRAQILGTDGYILATSPALPHAHAVLLSVGSRKRLLHMFDASGERYRARDRTDELSYLPDARTFVFVLDPTSVPAFWEPLADSQARSIDPALVSSDDPAKIFATSLQQAALSMGAPLSRSRLAVAISKTDVLERAGLLEGRQETDEWARRWLDDRLGLGHLVRAMSNEFDGNVRFFFTAAWTTAPEQAHPSIHRLLSWVFNLDSP